MARTRFLIIALAAALAAAPARAQRRGEVSLGGPLGECETLVVGFLGGRNAWDDDRRGVRRLALRLGDAKIERVRVATFENRKRGLALELIRDALDRDRDGRLGPDERESARVVLYGQSFGGAAVVKLARELGRLGVPVLLTVQVDSVGRDDGVIPPNVARAANLYQRGGLVRGQSKIRAADASRTTILGNYEYCYDGKEIVLPKVGWWERFYENLFAKPHTMMDADPEVWVRVEALVRSAIASECGGREQGSR